MISPISSGLVLSLETDSGLTTRDDKVIRWADSSGLENDLIAAGDPTLGLITTPSGAPAVELDGDGDKLERLANLSGLPSGSQDRTVFFVVDYENAQGTVAGAVYGDNARNEAFGLTVDPSDGDLLTQGYGAVNDFSTNTDGLTGGFLVQSVVLSSNQLLQYLNGTLVDTTSHTFNTDVRKLILGEQINNKGFADLNVAALLVYDRALDEAERQTVETYLQEKYLVDDGLNDAPIAVGDIDFVDGGGSMQTFVLTNDIDDGMLGADSITIVSGPAHGIISGIDPSTGAITYVHDGGSSESDSYSYTITDEEGVTSAPATVEITVNDNGFSLAGFSDETVLSREGMNAQSPFFLPISMAFLPDNRMLLLSKDGEILIVDPETGSNTTFMRLNNIDTGQERGLLDITLDPDFETNGYFYLYYTPNSPEHARIARFTYQENSGGLSSRGLLGSEMLVWEDTDGYLACCHYGGGLDFGLDGKIWLTTSDKFQATTPGEGPSGGEDLPIDLTSSSGKVIRVNADGSVPDGTDGHPANPYADDVDADGDPLTVTLVSDVSNGTLVLNADGSFDYTPDADFNGTDSFAYQISDNRGGVSQAIVTLNVAPVEDAAVANDDVYVTGPGTPLEVDAAAGVSLNDSDAEGDSIVPTLVSGVSNGTLVLNADGSFVYTPANGFEGTDSFTYSVPGGDTATVTIDVRAPADPVDAPVAVDDAFALDEDQTLTGNVLTDNGAGADSDPNDDPLTASIVATVAHGALTLNPDGSFAYTPETDFHGTDSFVYRISDGAGGFSQATVVLQIAPVDDAAVAMDDLYVVSTGVPLSVSATEGVTANDTDAEGDALMPALLTGVSNGTLSFAADGGFDYTPDDGFTGTDSFTYALAGGDTATVTLTVVDANTAPIARDDVFFSAEDSLFSGSVFDNALDEYIWAYGLRNPFRARWDAEYGNMYIGEVGGNRQLLAHDDIHVASLDQPGVFYGWPFYEGTPNTYVNDGQSPQDPTEFPLPDGDLGDPANGDFYSSPIFSLPHNGESVSLTGGMVYRGDMFPEEWDGVYFYGDYTNDYIRYLVLDETGTQSLGDYAFKPSQAFPSSTNEVVSIEVGADGALYYAMIASGEIRRVTYSETAVNAAPQIVTASLTPETGDLPLAVTFDAVVTDPEGDPLTYTVNFGDGTIASGEVDASGILSISHTYTTDGSYSVSLRVSDSISAVFSDSFDVDAGEVNAAPAITGEGSNVGLAEPGVTEVTFTATATDLDGDALTYTWNFGDGTTETGTVPASGIVTATHVYATDGSYNAFLEVSDGTDTTISSNVPLQVGEATEVPITNGLVLLLQSDIKIGLGAGNTVTAWLDGSGQGHNLFGEGDPQLVEGRTPTGQPAIVFDGEGDILQRVDAQDTIFSMPSGNADRTLFFVVNYLDPEGGESGFVYGDSSGNEAFGLVARRDGDAMLQGWSKANDFDSDVSAIAPGWMVQSVVLEADQYDHYIDGGLIDNGTHVFNTDIQKMVLGGQLNGRLESRLEIAAVLTYDRALGAAERSQVESFLQSKYVTGPNTDPVATDDAFSTFAGVGLSDENVLADNGSGPDTDADSDPLSVSLVSGPSNGTLVLDPDGRFDYAPVIGYSGSDSFIYEIADGRGGTDTATVSVTVLPPADPANRPVAADDAFAATEDTTLSGNVLTDNGGGPDIDPNGDPLTVNMVSDVSHGMLTLNSDGSFDYIPDADFAGTDSFEYEISDGFGGVDRATATIEVAPVDDPGIATNDSYRTQIGTPLVIGAVGGVLNNDSDVDTPLSAALVSSVSNGTLTLNADGSFDYTPAAGFKGNDSFTYALADGTTATVSINVGTGNPVVGGLVAAYSADENVSLGAGNTVTGWLDGSGRGNDLVAEGDPQLVGGATPTGQSAIIFDGVDDVLQRIGATDTLNGLPSGNADRTLFFVVNYLDPEGGESGFVYGDSSGNEAFGLVAKRDGDAMVQGWGKANDFDSDVSAIAPGWMVQSVVLKADHYDHYIDGGLIDSGAHVFNTDLQKMVLGGQLNGRLESRLEIASVFAYDRALTEAERTQVESFLQTKYVAGPNAAPVAVADSFTTVQNIPLSDRNVLADNGSGPDTDADGDPLTVTLVSGVSDGVLTLNSDGSFVYTPNIGFTGSDSFTYAISDGRGGADQTNVSLTITPSADPADRPVAADDAVTVTEDTAFSGNVLADNGNGPDSDPNGDPLTVMLVSDVSNGVLTLNSNGSFDYVPDADFFGSDSFEYRLFDGTGGVDTGVVAIEVLPVDDPGVAANDTYRIEVGGTLAVTALTGVLANDNDVDTPLSAALVSGVSNGTLTLNADGSFDYTPTVGFEGTDSFTYALAGGATATVSINVSTGNPVVGGLVASYEAGKNVSLGAGSTVTGWLDDSGRGNDLVAEGDPQLVAGATPTGQSAIVFDGADDLLQRIGATDTLNGLPSGNADRTLFFVVDYQDTNDTAAGFVYGDTSRNEAFGLAVKREGDAMIQGWGRANDFDSDVPVVSSGWVVQSVVLEAGQFEHFLNDNLIDTGSHVFSTDLQKMMLGGNLNGTDQAQMEIAAALAYDRALTDAERSDVTTFLQTKYVNDAFDVI